MTSKIIKGSRASGEGAEQARRSAEIYPEEGGVVHKRVLDAREKAEAILGAATEEAEKIRLDAKAVLEKARVDREAAVKKGYAEGESKGLAQVTEKLLHLERLREKFYDDAEPEMIKLVASIAEKVIGRIAAENTDLIRSVVRQALERALGDRITVSVNPEDYRTLMEGEHEFKETLDRTKRLIFREDESVSKGGCVVETEVGTIDARIETQLEAIRKALVS